MRTNPVHELRGHLRLGDRFCLEEANQRTPLLRAVDHLVVEVRVQTLN